MMSHPRVSKFFFVFVLACLAPLTHAQLTALPSEVVFHDYDELVEVIVSRNGALVSKSDMGRARFLVDGNNYIRMIDVERHDGVLVLRPTSVLEAGRYTLELDVGRDRISIDVDARLDEVPGSIEAQAREAGVSVEEMKRALGLATQTQRASVSLQLAERYPIGTMISFEMPVPGDDKFAWYVNGSPTHAGEGSHTFQQVLTTTGTWYFRYTETPANGRALEAAATTEAYAEPAIVFDVDANQPVLLRVPDGYDSAIWSVNEVVQADSGDLEYSFRTPGDYRVECRAKRSDESFRVVTYDVRVR